MDTTKCIRTIATLTLLAMFACIPLKAGALDLWPLLEINDERTMVLYPLYDHEDDFMMVFPFYYRTNQGKDNHIVWPMVKFSEGRLTRAVPFWFAGDKGSFTMAPLIRQTPEYTAWAIPPIYTRHDGQFKAVYPFFAKSPNMLWVAPTYYQKGGSWAVWPLYWDTQKNGKSSQTIPGLFYSAKTDSSRTLWIVPSYYHKNGDALSWYLFPFYFHNKTTSTGSDTIPLLYYNGHTPNSHSLWILPSYYCRTGNEVEWDLVPFYFQSRSPEKSSYKVPFVYNYESDKHGTDLWLIPFYSKNRENDHATAIYPLWYSSKTGAPGDERSFLWLFPYIGTKTQTSHEEFVLPLYHNRVMTGFKEHDMFLLPWVYGTSPTKSYSGLLPIYYASKKIEGDKTKHTFNLLWPIYHRDRTVVAGKETEYNRRVLIFSDAKKADGTRGMGIMGLMYEWTPESKTGKQG